MERQHLYGQRLHVPMVGKEIQVDGMDHLQEFHAPCDDQSPHIEQLFGDIAFVLGDRRVVFMPCGGIDAGQRQLEGGAVK